MLSHAVHESKYIKLGGGGVTRPQASKPHTLTPLCVATTHTQTHTSALVCGNPMFALARFVRIAASAADELLERRQGDGDAAGRHEQCHHRKHASCQYKSDAAALAAAAAGTRERV